MASHQAFSSFLFLLCLLQSIRVGYSATFTITNKCTNTIWPGILSNAGTDQLSTTGFALGPGESNTLSVPTSWSGRLWGRTLCSQDSTTGKFTCVTGDCGSSAVECAGGGAAPPATLAEFTLNGAGGLDFYDVSLVDGYNLPMLVVAEGGTGGNCTTTGCVVDLNAACPSELKLTSSDEGVACKSACEAFGDPQYCCSGAYATPDTCKPSSYSQFFKTACPKAYSYAYDDGTSTFTCASANYITTFCPAPSTSVKSSNGQVPGAVDVSASLRNTMPNFVVMAVTVMAAAWRLLPLFLFSVADFTLKISHRRSDLTLRLSRLRGGPKHLDIFWKPTPEEMGPTIPSEVTTLLVGLYGVQQSYGPMCATLVIRTNHLHTVMM